MVIHCEITEFGVFAALVVLQSSNADETQKRNVEFPQRYKIVFTVYGGNRDVYDM